MTPVPPSPVMVYHESDEPATSAGGGARVRAIRAVVAPVRFAGKSGRDPYPGTGRHTRDRPPECPSLHGPHLKRLQRQGRYV